MPYIVRFHDNPDHEDQRQIHMAAHLDFLERHGARVWGAGPLMQDGQVAGGLWIVEANSVDEVEAMVRADPFFPTGLRDRWEVQEWRQVLKDGARLI